VGGLIEPSPLGEPQRVNLRPLLVGAVMVVLVVGLLLIQAIANLYLPDLNADIINNGVAKGDTDYIMRTGGRPGVNTPLLAAAGVGVARQVCQYALDSNHDLSEAGELATAFAATGMLQLGAATLKRLHIRHY